jgi:hypothetical protein
MLFSSWHMSDRLRSGDFARKEIRMGIRQRKRETIQLLAREVIHGIPPWQKLLA